MTTMRTPASVLCLIAATLSTPYQSPLAVAFAWIVYGLQRTSLHAALVVAAPVCRTRPRD